MVQLYPDADPPPEAEPFAFWRIPGHKRLIHDGRRLVFMARLPGQCVRVALAPSLQDGMAYVHAVRAGQSSRGRLRALASELDKLQAVEDAVHEAVAVVKPRPAPAALLELHTLQALDGTLAGASLRTVADVLFGTSAVAADWNADGDLRARVRRLVRSA